MLYIFENTYTFISVNEICKKLKHSKFGIMVTSEKGGCEKGMNQGRRGVYEMGRWGGAGWFPGHIKCSSKILQQKTKKLSRGSGTRYLSVYYTVLCIFLYVCFVMKMFKPTMSLGKASRSVVSDCLQPHRL